MCRDSGFCDGGCEWKKKVSGEKKSSQEVLVLDSVLTSAGPTKIFIWDVCQNCKLFTLLPILHYQQATTINTAITMGKTKKRSKASKARFSGQNYTQGAAATPDSANDIKIINEKVRPALEKPSSATLPTTNHAPFRRLAR